MILLKPNQANFSKNDNWCKCIPNQIQISSHDLRTPETSKNKLNFKPIVNILKCGQILQFLKFHQPFTSIIPKVLQAPTSTLWPLPTTWAPSVEAESCFTFQIEIMIKKYYNLLVFGLPTPIFPEIYFPPNIFKGCMLRPFHHL